MTPENAKNQLCRTFCDGLSVSTVPIGLAVSTSFILPDGDPATFYLRETPDGFVLEDDGEFVATAQALGMTLDAGVRGSLFKGILSEGDASLDHDTLQIRSRAVPESEVCTIAPKFLSALIRTRDLFLLTSERVAATFFEDVHRAIESALGDRFDLEDDLDADIPADIVLKHKATGLRAALIYAVNNNEKLLSALLRFSERDHEDAPIIAMMDNLQSSPVSNKTFMLAQNRGLLMPFFGADRTGAIRFVEQHIRVDTVH